MSPLAKSLLLLAAGPLALLALFWATVWWGVAGAVALSPASLVGCYMTIDELTRRS